MRLTNRVYAQHLDWMFKKHWQVQGKRTPLDTGAAAELRRLGIEVKDVQEVLADEKLFTPVEIVGDKPKVQPEDATHPNWHDTPCHVYGNSNVLLQGMPQAQVLTKTIEITGFPRNIEESINRMQLPAGVDHNVQHSILAAHVFDAQQVKLPKVKLPERPAYNLPREYGISHERRFRLLINKLLFECEKLAGRSVTSRRQFLDDVNFSAIVPKSEDLLQFSVSAEKMVTSTRPLEPVKGQYTGELPELYPLKSTITIPKKHIYSMNTEYPIRSTLSCSHPHTVFLSFNKETVGHLHKSSVSKSQYQSRTLVKAFAVAAARAKQLYGEAALGNLPKPIVVQSVQSDGQNFHFGVFQLNTLSLGGVEGTKNYWFSESDVDLYSECGYKAGRPHLHGYNKDVFRLIAAFYNSS